MFCPNCGNKFEGKFCTRCGMSPNETLEEFKQRTAERNAAPQAPIQQAPIQQAPIQPEPVQPNASQTAAAPKAPDQPQVTQPQPVLPQAAQPAESVNTPAEKPQSSKKLIIIIAVLAAVLVIVIAAFCIVLLSGNKLDKSDGKDEETSVSEIEDSVEDEDDNETTEAETEAVTTIEQKYKFMESNPDRVEAFLNILGDYYMDRNQFDTTVPVSDEAASMMEDYYEYEQTESENYGNADYLSFIYVGTTEAYDGTNYVFLDNNNSGDPVFYFEVSVNNSSITWCEIGSEYFTMWKNGHPAQYWEDKAVEYIEANYPQFNGADIDVIAQTESMWVMIETPESIYTYTLSYDLKTFTPTDEY